MMISLGYSISAVLIELQNFNYPLSKHSNDVIPQTSAAEPDVMPASYSSRWVGTYKSRRNNV